MFGDALRQDETGSAPQITRAKADVNQCSRWRWHRIGGYGSNKGRVQGTAYLAARMKRDHPSYAAVFAAGKHSSTRQAAIALTALFDYTTRAAGSKSRFCDRRRICRSAPISKFN